MNLEMINKIKNADALIISASNGFSISEGLNIFASDQTFHQLFNRHIKKYHLQNILHGLLISWPNQNDQWDFLSTLIDHYCLKYQPGILMNSLKTIIKDKPYFIVTSNGENHFELAGFDPDYLLEIEGSWKEMRCSNPTCNQLYATYDIVKKIQENKQNGIIPDYLIPKCPLCGSQMKINSAFKVDNYNRFQQFINNYCDKNLVVLELGIGPKNQLIKGPLMNLIEQCPNSYYITINKGELYILDSIKKRSIGLDGSLNDILPEIAKLMG